MTREEIRKGIEAYTDRPAELWAYLHENGMVIRVERELPKDKGWWTVADTYYAKGLKYGFVAVEPLI